MYDVSCLSLANSSCSIAQLVGDMRGITSIHILNPFQTSMRPVKLLATIACQYWHALYNMRIMPRGKELYT